MGLLKRRRDDGAEPTSEQSPDPLDQPKKLARPQKAKTEPRSEPNNAGGTIVHTPAHIEKALAGLTARMEDSIQRIDSVERKLHELAETMANFPSHSDVLEVRMHSAKLASELAKTTMELRGEIGMANEEARRAARMASSPDSSDPEVYIPEEVQIDLRREGVADDTPTQQSESA